MYCRSAWAMVAEGAVVAVVAEPGVPVTVVGAPGTRSMVAASILHSGQPRHHQTAVMTSGRSPTAKWQTATGTEIQIPATGIINPITGQTSIIAAVM